MNEESKLITNRMDVLEKWKRHFFQLLNNFNLIFLNKIFQKKLGTRTMKIFLLYVVKLRNNKGPGLDELPGELLKCGESELLKTLQNIII